MYSNIFANSWWQCMTVINDPECVCHSIVPVRMRKLEVQRIWRQWLEDQHYGRGIWKGNRERLEKEYQRLKNLV